MDLDSMDDEERGLLLFSSAKNGRFDAIKKLIDRRNGTPPIKLNINAIDDVNIHNLYIFN